ncbi:potassium transporter KefB [Flavobacterium sp. J49]|uniref:potassium transporter KefB n=1 Tax=Flavobacterium sp. J49 TaxID=2718534 RepID=UPI0015942D56|nr:potassium transporter KefB [Flavobacterium sp. J49]MBF6642416.1 potassium transporter KefB [Flavobacterium sp. J49]NIC03662.1 potassium transporter KefB [Flavobacterium sp. J49]
MTQRHHLTETNHKSLLLKPVLIGAVIALLLIALFLIPIQDPNPEWGKFWMVRPFILVTLAGAIGGAVYHFMAKMGPQTGWKKTVTVIASILIYVIGLWIGTVLGLDGTLWD